jgi:hypothetical protein
LLPIASCSAALLYWPSFSEYSSAGYYCRLLMAGAGDEDITLSLSARRSTALPSNLPLRKKRDCFSLPYGIDMIWGVIRGLLCDEQSLLLMAFSLTVNHWYFATGHGTQFNSLHFSAPFVGFDTFNWIPSGATIAFNTHGCTFLLLCIVPPYRLVETVEKGADGSLTPAPASAASAAGGGRVKISSHSAVSGALQGWTPQQSLTTLLIPPSLSLLGTAVVNFVMRRHLMVWAIFAPKFIFDSIMFIIAVPSTFFS